MGIFDSLSSLSPLVVSAPALGVYVSHATPAADLNPTYSAFALENRLQVTRLFRGSSVCGASNGRLALAAGRPAEGTQTEPEDAPAVLAPGDRVIVAVGTRPIWGGYCTGVNIQISGRTEGAGYTLMGPEWMIGAGGGRHGCIKPVYGQARRKPANDATWASNPAGNTPSLTSWAVYPALPTVFNPAGRPNSSFYNELLGPTPGVGGRIFETPDRKHPTATAADPWTLLYAAQHLGLVYNDPDHTGITIDTGALEAGDIIRDVNVDGMTLWDALKELVEPNYGFWVTTIPDSVSAFTGFTLRFFNRSAGTVVSLPLNARGTSITVADACVARLDVSRDIAAVVNSIDVVGERLSMVELRYHGEDTPGLSALLKKTALQHGWPASDLNLEDYHTALKREVNRATIDSKSGTFKARWRDRYTTTGVDFASYRHAGRLFVWNEGADFVPATGVQPRYKATGYDWYAPDLAGIAEPVGGGLGADKYCRQRRRVLDTPYPDVGNTYRRLRPQLFFAICETAGGTIGPWVNVPSTYWRLDPEMAAIWIIVEDMAAWRPFQREEMQGVANVVNDLRTYSTLLNSGKLRMCLVGCIAQDQGVTGGAVRQNESPCPQVRKTVVRRPDSIIRVDVWNDGVASPIAATPPTINEQAYADTLATQWRRSGEDAQVHSSVTVEADWPEVPMGSILGNTTGRVVDMAANTSGGHRAQVVGQVMDPNAMAWELLTESAAKALSDADRRRGRNSRKNQRQWRERIR